jgi:2-methylcitrate dehydratase PrpD
VSAIGTQPLTEALAERASSLRYDDIPEDVLEAARNCLLDWFAVTLAGSSQPGPEMLLDVFADARGAEAGSATVVGHRSRLAPLPAALVNGTASHVLDFDDVNTTFLGHVSVSTLAAALALAEQLDANAAELLTAFVAGYETACRIAVAIGPGPYMRGYHATGTIGTFGAAAACARLLGLDAARSAAAIGIAASEAAGLKCNFGTMTKALHAGSACQSGLLAAMLAARGFTSNPGAIEGAQGFAAVVGGRCDAAAALAEPPSGWHVRDNIFKHHASCFFTHSTIEGLRELTSARPLLAEEIERVVVHVSDLELGTCVIAEPVTALEVKFSLAHLAAMTLLGRATSRISDDDASDADVIALRARVELVEDGKPREPTLVEVELRGSEVLRAGRNVESPRLPPKEERRRLVEKFLPLAETVLPRPAADQLLASLSDVSADQAVRGLMAGARP